MVDDPGMIVTPTQEITGHVSLANMQGRYVVLTFPIGTLPEPGRQLSLYRNGLKVAEIRVSGPHRDNSTVADLLTGEARVGDEVR